MTELAITQITGAVALVLAVAGWLTTSLLAPGPGRERAAWLATFGIYGALCSLFAHLLIGALESGGMAARLGFGTLLALFASGLVVSVFRLAGSFRPHRTRREADATH